MLESFLEAGASPNLVICLDPEKTFHPTMVNSIFYGFDVDVSRLPLGVLDKDSTGQRITAVMNTTSGTADPVVRPLRLYFRRKNAPRDESREIKYIMDEAQIEEMYALLRSLLDTPPRSSRARKGLVKQVYQWVGAIYERHCPEDYDQQDWKIRSWEDIEESDDSDYDDDSDDSDDSGDI